MKQNILVAVILLASNISCAPAQTPTPLAMIATATPTNSVTPTATDTSTPTLAATFTPSPTSSPTITPTPTNTSTPTPPSKPLARLHVQGTNILDDKGNVFQIKGIRMPLDFMPCPTAEQISNFVEKAAKWNFNAIDIGIDPTRWTCKRDTLAIAMDVTKLANQRGLYTLMMIAPLHKPSRPGESALTFDPSADDLEHYVEWWRDAGKLIGNNPGFAAVQLYNELDYTQNIQGDWKVSWIALGPFWSGGTGPATWLGGPNDDDALWEKILQPVLSR